MTDTVERITLTIVDHTLSIIQGAGSGSKVGQSVEIALISPDGDFVNTSLWLDAEPLWTNDDVLTHVEANELPFFIETAKTFVFGTHHDIT